jgi:hypothetical protein
MAYVSKERKATLVAFAKPILAKYGIKATFAVRNHNTIVCNIKSGKIDFGQFYNFDDSIFKNYGYISVNPYHFEKHFKGIAQYFLIELFHALNRGNHDKSDLQSDYFNVGWYVDVNIGNYDKPYDVTA